MIFHVFYRQILIFSVGCERNLHMNATQVIYLSFRCAFSATEREILIT